MNARTRCPPDDRKRRRGRNAAGRIGRHLRAGIAVLAPVAIIALPVGGATAAPTVQITEAGTAVPGLSTPNQIAETLLGPGVTLDGPATINGTTDPVDYDARLPSFGRSIPHGSRHLRRRRERCVHRRRPREHQDRRCRRQRRRRPPAVFLQGGSVRFSDTSTPAPAPTPVAPSASSAASDSVTPSAPPAPPAPVAPPAPAPPAPRATPDPAPSTRPAPAPPIARSLTPAVIPPIAGAPGGEATQMVHRVQFDEVGRYTFVYINRATGKRIVQLRGTRIGKRTVNRRVSAPILNNQRPGKRMVLASRFARRALPANPDQIALRIILRRPDGTLRGVTMAQDGTLN